MNKLSRARKAEKGLHPNVWLGEHKWCDAEATDLEDSNALLREELLAASACEAKLKNELIQLSAAVSAQYIEANVICDSLSHLTQLEVRALSGLRCTCMLLDVLGTASGHFDTDQPTYQWPSAPQSVSYGSSPEL